MNELKTFSALVGAENQLEIERIRLGLVAGKPISPLAIIAGYGNGKTVLGRLILKAYCCPNTTATGDPCNRSDCPDCSRHGPKYNYVGTRRRHVEYDCPNLKRTQVRARVRHLQQEDGIAVFWDEFGSLDQTTMKMLLKISEDFPGIFIIALADYEFESLPPPLFERMDTIWLTTPTIDEVAAYFTNKAQGLGISTEPDAVRLAVEHTDRSFRACWRFVRYIATKTPTVLDRAAVLRYFKINETQATQPRSGFPLNIFGLD